MVRVFSFAGLTAAALSFSVSPAFADQLHIPPESPWWMHALGRAALYGHIGGGVAGLLSGALALVVRKGEHLHRLFGTVFFISMLTMAGIALPVSVLMADRVNVLAAFFTLYMLFSAWVTVRRKDGEVGRFEVVGLLIALAVIATAGFFIAEQNASPTGMIGGAPPQAAYIFVTFASIAAACDLRVILSGGISGVPRVARHLWRMCFALFVASGSLFLGQMQLFPGWFRQTPLPFVLALAPLALLLFWLVFVRFAKAFRPAAA